MSSEGEETMAAIQINAEPGTEMHAAIVALLKDRKKVKSGKITFDEWMARAASLLAENGGGLWS